MKLALKVIIVFLIIFRFRIPVLFDTTFLAVVLCSIYYFFTKRRLPFTYLSRRYVVNIFIGMFLLVWVVVFITVIHGEYDFFLLKVFGFQVAMLFAVAYALPLLLEGEEEYAFESAATIVCYAFAVQGFIILMAFLIPPFGDFMIDIKPNAEELRNSSLSQTFRGYALTGSVFYELPSGFGVAWILFIRILTMKNQTYITGYKPYIIFVLLFTGSMFTGRTAFAGFILAILMGLFLIKNPLGFISKNLIPVFAFVILLAGAYAVLPTKQRRLLTEDVFPFAFEAYYSYERTGRIATASSDAMIYNHYYRLPDETLLHGKGRFVKDEGGFYGNTDAGYMRNALYGGIFYIICMILYQLLYFIKPFLISGGLRYTREGYGDFILFLTLFLHIFVLEYKGSALVIMNIMEALVFFMGFSYLIRYYHREEELYS